MAGANDPPPNIPNPDPSIITTARLAEAVSVINFRMDTVREEIRRWVDSLQLLHEEKIKGAEDKTANLDRVVQTRLAGSETALNAAMAASDKVVAKIETGVGAIMNEMKASFTKQIDSLDEKIDDLKERMSESGGHKQGTSQMIAWIIAAIAALAAVAMFITVLSRPAPEVHVTGSVAQPQQPQHMIWPRV
jgi:hypothetical protein